MNLTIAAADAQGQALSQPGGPTVPDWGGAQAGLAGTTFAKMLRDVESGEAPMVSYCEQTLVVTDTRIPAMETATSVYTCTAPATSGPVITTAELRFRRAFQAVMDDKGWTMPDIAKEQARTSLSVQPRRNTWLPLSMRDELTNRQG